MGSFVLLRKADGARIPDPSPALKVFEEQHLPTPTLISNDRFDLYLYPFLADGALAIANGPNGSFAAAAGTLVYRGRRLSEGLQLLLLDIIRGEPKWSRLMGSYWVIVDTGSETQMFIDQAGSFKAYATASKSIISSSLLATCALTRRKTLNRQSCYEYVLQGAFYGWQTPINEITCLRGERRYRLDGSNDFYPWKIDLPVVTLDMNFDEAREKCLSLLSNIFDDVANAFATGIDTALSGGYDSRLILALLRTRGITPRLHVYGHQDSDDVRVAKTIAQSESLMLHHEDKSAWPEPNSSEFSEIVQRNYVVFDGLPNDGIVDNGRDLASRLERVADNHVALNGGGGEIFRNFFYLPNRHMSVRELLWSFYCQFDPKICTDSFSTDDYLERLADKVLAAIGRSNSENQFSILSRHEVELVYPLFRGQFWAARNLAANNRIGPVLVPFMEPQLTALSAAIPLKFKTNGKLEAAMIAALDPALASYQSAYGHSFDRAPPPKSRLLSALGQVRPPRLRRLMARLGEQHRRRALGPANQKPVEILFDGRLECVSDLFRPNSFANNDKFNRLLSLEYFMRDQNIG